MDDEHRLDIGDRDGKLMRSHAEQHSQTFPTAPPAAPPPPPHPILCGICGENIGDLFEVIYRTGGWVLHGKGLDLKMDFSGERNYGNLFTRNGEVLHACGSVAAIS